MPKKYPDIYPLNFDNDPDGIYNEIVRVVMLWVDAAKAQGQPNYTEGVTEEKKSEAKKEIDEVAKARRDGTLVLIRPVTTSTEGRVRF